MKKMRAMVLQEFGASLVEQRVDIPEIGEGEVLVKVKACGLCFTDVKIISGKMPNTRPLPLIPGHEVAGEVMLAGPGVQQVAPGERVSVNFYLTCGVCRYCRSGSETLCLNLKGQLGRSVNGGYAEYISVPAENLLPLPAEIPYEQGAVLADAVATALHAVRERACVRPGQRVGVIGIGGVGIHVLQMARLSGAEVMAMDIREECLAFAREYGAEHVVNLGDQDAEREAASLTGGQGLDAVVDTVGNQKTISFGLKLLANRGRMVLLGYDPEKPFSADSLGFVLREIAIMGSRAATKHELSDAIRLVQRGAIKPAVTASYPLAEANRVLDLLRQGKIVGRAVLLPESGDAG